MIRSVKTSLSAGLSGLALGWLALSAAAAPPVAMPVNLPLYFEANQGQADGPARFIARGHDFEFMISPAEAQIMLRQAGARPAVVRLQFAGANALAPIQGDAELPGKINYLTGSNPAQWRTGVPMFSQVRVGEPYPGVNLVYYGNQQRLEYDFTVAPGANPQAIAMHFDGADKITIGPQDELILGLPGGEIRQPKPLIYQTRDGVRKEIKGGYRMVDAHTVAFAVGDYDHSQPLVIDPVLSYSTYFGGSAGDAAYAVALDSDGNVYMAGQTLSKQISATRAFATPGAFQTNFAGGTIAGDVFVCKLNASNGAPAYITYLGGSADDGAFCLAVDGAGRAYVAGATDSPDFPITNAIPGHEHISGTLSQINNYPTDAFVAELDASGSNLIYSTYLGGESSEAAYGLAVDSSANAYLTGFTYSTNFPTTANALQPNLASTNSFYFNANAFVTEIASNGQSLVFSTYFGGNNLDMGKGIAVDTNGFVYVAGFTASTNFPNVNAFQHTLNRSTNQTSSFDAFVAEFYPTGTNLVYSTYLGSTNNDGANGIALDNTGAAYVTGGTLSSNFPNTVGMTVPGLSSFLATNTSSSVASNAFLTKIIFDGTNAVVAWSALFGGNGVDVGNAVALDPAGDIFVAGSASSINFPTFNVPTLMRSTNSGQTDAFVIAFGATGTNLLYSTYLGGRNNDFGYGLAVDTNGDAYVVGQTLSQNFLTNNANIPLLNYPSLNGPSDAFLTKIMLTVQPPVITTNPPSQTNGVGTSVTLSVGLSGTPPFYFQWQHNGLNLVNGGNISGATNSATLTISNAQTTNSGYYWLIITNYGGSVTSSVTSPYGFLEVTNAPPDITQQPASQTNGVGTTVTFTINGTGTPPFHFQWWKDGTSLTNGGRISGATNVTLTISNVQTNDAGNYSIIVTNLGGSTPSSNAVLTVLASPVITVQPATNQSMSVGSTATFTVTAIGTVPLKYQWWDGTNVLKNGSVNNGPTISGATTNVLTISNAQMTNSGNYTVVVTNISGSVTSSNAVLTVTNIPPSITQQPASQTNGVGTTVTFSINGNASPPFFFQWWKDGTSLTNGGRISGATNVTLTISNVQTNDAGSYSIIVTNFGGSATSSNAVLTVLSSPMITVQPATNQSMAVGSTATFAVTAIGAVPLRYQWWDGTNQLKNGTVNNGPTISGATTNVLTISNTQTTNSGNFTVVVTNVAGSVTSSNAVLSVTNIPPAITLQPTNQTLAVGSNVTLVVHATGTAPLSYQWQLGGVNLVNGHTNGATIGGATTNVLTISTVQLTNGGNYTVVVTNFGGSVTSSPDAVLTVTNIPPAITLQPTNQTISMGSPVSFVVTATGPAPLSYQWQVDGTNLANGGSITGATTNVLKISNASTNNSSTNYSVVVTNLGGSVTSSIVSLTVLGSPVITLQPATNQAMAVGSTATFTVTAIGMVPLSYRWQLNGTNLVNGGRISGVTTTNLVISNAQTNNSGTNYTVVVTNLAGSVTSSIVVLSVTNIPPLITAQPPANPTNGVGTTVTLAVAATGTAPLSYQWQLNGTSLTNGGSLSGATTNVLKITNVQLTNSGSYLVYIANSGGSTNSSAANLTVEASPVILMQPIGLTNAVGATATLAVTAAGTVPLIYQWWDGTNLVKNGSFSGATISGATTGQLNISNAQTNNTGNYTVTVTNISGSVTSLVTSLLVTNIMPTIIPPFLPTSLAVAAGSNVTFTVSATGTAPLSYQWQVNGTNLANGGSISGATANLLRINNAQTNNTGNYTVVVTNYGGSATGSVSLIVASSPVILMMQPTNQAIAVGSNATFVVTAIGILPLKYQWQVNGTNLVNGLLPNGGFISGATNNSLTLGVAQQARSGNYTVVVTNSAGSVTSPVVSLTVTNIPPAITLQPTNQTVGAGSTVTLVVNATGTAPLSYQWQVDETNLLVDGGQITGATNATLTITNVQTTNNGNYTVTVLNPGGSLISSNAVLTVTNIPPAITLQPTNQTVAVGSTVTLVVNATGTAPLSYQWQVDETNLLVDGGQITGATNATLTITNVQTTNIGSYTVTITNAGGSVISSNAVLTVTNIPPAITLQPTNQTVTVGSTVTLVVNATGTAPLSYQWQVDETNLLVDGGQISGAISNVLTISNVQLINGGSYSVTVTNLGGQVTSSNAVLTVMIASSPSFGQIIAAGGGGFVLSGTGGGSNGTYYVLTSSDLLVPLTNWTAITTDQFDSAGNFIFTNTPPTNAPQLFYILQLP